ncbi:N-acetylglucosaminidase [Clostridium oryzae]|uniref:Beta-N-acetylglucosaminidase n=1 Tax=Clostridium oryzae TaxID=1450648 RepID=A0A1V4IYU1_9CLOT|nr:Ig-like domain-containing protein [Clostridium oryzae]OPJ65063.1 beta-N-acetylglucosaminidase precursor [Clostridium oryzae]
MRKHHFIVVVFMLMLFIAAGVNTKTYAAEKHKIKKIKYSVLKDINRLESPENGAEVTDNDGIALSGYFLSRKRIKSATVYVDGKLKGNAKTGIARLDIAKKYHQYGSKIKTGYSYKIDTLNMDKGKHSIKVKITTSDNKTVTTVRNFKYSGQASRFAIEKPKNHYSTNRYNMTISGYALSAAGTKEIDVYVDGIFWDFAQLNMERQDIAAKYPKYSNAANSGFKYVLDMSSQKRGRHTITIEVWENNGKKYSQAIHTVYNKPSPKLRITGPKASKSINTAELTVKGWSVGASGIDNVAVYLDGKAKGKAAIGIATSAAKDVLKLYKGAANAGYRLKFDITTLPIGKHTLEVRSTDLDDITISKKFKFNMNGAVKYKKYSNSFHSYVNGQYEREKNFVGNSTKEAGKDELYDAMSPSNYVKDPQGRFMFLMLNYASGIKAGDLNAALKHMGILEGHGSAFLKAAKKYHVNPIYLAAHAIHETDKGTSELANGVKVSSAGGKAVEGKIVYNMYGIGANDGKAVKNGSERAYKEGWYSVDKAIVGGAEFISTYYIQSSTNKQYTLYKMKWNFAENSCRPDHEYATDIYWAYNQTKYIKDIVDKMKNPVLVFEVPKFTK